ncbi:LLM class flavin-dependent oxidoreductase [Paenibacillus sp. GCM10012307]|uniref:LLM class flavin-dependent oxidoreductase n=1 Tax=Paenibacillus roseus TaxID=2798579 RepID=A0A934J6I7_9BACL|nr:LLM class flavin-dependent oxidoreductase [Paenibacillus roseus]MBJ6362523.1 LLM class flavin-dependent oxidoreductase [Paenibacillus roseus]
MIHTTVMEEIMERFHHSIHLSIGLTCHTSGLSLPFVGQWSTERYRLDYYKQAVQWAELGCMDAVLLDGALLPSHLQETKGVDPVTLAAALTPTSKHIGLIPTLATAHYEPYFIARGLASLDHISKGRSGWLLHTPSLQAEVERSGELLSVTRKLWDSWKDGAVIIDKEAGIYARPELVQPINHHGTYFQVKGPLNVNRPLQGHPVIACGIAREEEFDTAIKHADWIVLHAADASMRQAHYTKLKQLAAANGRDPNQLRISQLIHIEEINNKASTHSMSNVFDGPFIGNMDNLLHAMIHAIDTKQADGFHFVFDHLHQHLPSLIEQLIPELQQRGLFRQSYSGRTLRQHLGLQRPAAIL